MPGFDDRLKQHLEEVAPPADPSGAFDRILEKKIRRGVMRRFQAAGLAVAVIAATVGGTFALYNAFGPTEHPKPRPGNIPLRGNGKIAFVREAAGAYDIYTVDPDGTGVHQLTHEAPSDVFPAWSPNGKRIAFVQATEAGQDVVVMNFDGTGEVNLTNTPTVKEGDPAWSPDGQRIAFASTPPEGVTQIWLMGAKGKGARQVTDLPFSVNHPVWSPDGRRIAFSEVSAGGAGGIWVMNSSGTGARQIFEDPLGATDLLRAGSWSPDGKGLLFTRVLRHAEGDSSFDVYAIGSDGFPLLQLTEDGASGDAVWSPDGTRIVYTSGAAVYVMNADGSDPRLLVDGAASFGVSWQPAEASSSPTPEPTPTLTPSPLPSGCDASQVTGNFDGDGQPDTATVAKTECFSSEPGGAGDQTEYSLQVRWPPSEGIAPLPNCRTACRAIAAADINADGIDEFILQVDEGRTTNIFQVYELPASEAFGEPSDVAEPGAPGFPAGKPARFSLGGSVEHYVALGCDLIEHQVIVQIAELNAEQTRFKVHEILLRFTPIEASPFGRFTVVSERDFTEPYEAGVGPGDQFEPGDPCWMQAF